MPPNRSWCGQTRWNGNYRLTKGRFIVGYALAENGMLFRGEFVTGRTDDEARRAAIYISNFFAAFDAEDEANFDPDA